MNSKDKILNAALKLFIKEGFHGTSTSKIAQEACMSNGAIFHYFKTKEDLISRLYIKIKEDYKNYLLDHMIPRKTSKGNIKQLWLSCVTWTLVNKDCATFYIMFSNSPYIDHLSKEEASRNFYFLTELFQKAIDDDTLINIDPNFIMNSLVASVQALTNYVEDNPDKLEEYLDMAFKLWWRSVANI